MSIKYSEGSDWRVWDLHIHTPKSIINEYGGDTKQVWDEFIDKLEQLPEEVKVIGITDYYFIDGYEKVMSYWENGRLKNLEMIFPILEFRIDTFGTNNGKNFLKTNLHILFNVDMNDYKNQVKKINEEFIGRINLSSLEKHSTKVLSKDNFIKEASDSNLQTGFAEFYPSTEQVLTVLNSQTWKENVFLFLGFKEWNNTDKGKQVKHYKEDILSKVHGVFADAKLEDIPKKQDIISKLSDKKLFHSQDIHTFEELNEYYCYTWLKADPTFEGLKQILYAPERVKISEDNPYLNIPKSYFSNLKIKDSEIFNDKSVRFKECNIPLNRDLVAIIGGRGTGKSLLLDSISKTLNKNIEGTRAESINSLEDFKVEYTQEDGTINEYYVDSWEENFVEYTHVSQSDVQQIATDPKKLGDAIFDLLMIYSDTITQRQEDTIQEIISDILDNKDWLYQENENCELINSISYNEKQKEIFEKRIDSITNQQNKQLIKKYRNNNTKKSKLTDDYSEVEELIVDLKDVQINTNKQLEGLNEKFSKDFSIPLITLKDQITKLSSLKEHILKTKQEALQENKRIEEEFRKEGIEGDISTLLEKVEGYQNNIEKFNRKIEEVKAVTEENRNLLNRRKAFATHLNKKMTEKIEEVDKKWCSLRKGNKSWSLEQTGLLNDILEDISVYAEIYFDKTLFYQKLEKYLNGNKFRVSRGSSETKQSKINSFINVNNYEDFVILISNEPIIKVADDTLITIETLFDEYSEYISSNGEREFLNVLFTTSEREQYLNVYPMVMYNGKQPNELSIGQRGTLFISLKLATDSFSTPFVFDQPEDDLDNMFIVQKLIPILNKLKKFRQIIIVTHNANVVVNSDADQVIIAHNDFEAIGYLSGSLENTYKVIGQSSQNKAEKDISHQGIKEHVCDILEGGEVAFENREKRYSIKGREILQSQLIDLKLVES
ncbi:TrlF family AAA-like ATPase [Thalassobacillus hwangdonensis]|uniref:TrlF family AAA-like ATPase n=1 Tax=Thalassobacillus hwangdonensis TaxID=546108 RepID=A0ABW3KZB3_9BACI